MKEKTISKKIENDGWWMGVLEMVVREGLSEEVIFEQRSEG